MRFIRFGLLSFHNIYPLYASFGFLLGRATLRLAISNTQYNWNSKPLFFTFFMFLSEFAVGLFDCSLYCCGAQRRKKETKNGKLNLNLYFDLIKPKKTDLVKNYLTIILIILIEGGCFYLGRLINVLAKSTINIADEARCLKLICDSFFCYLFFKYIVYKHHFFSIILIIIGVTLQFIPEFIKESSQYYFIFIYFINNALLSLRDCLEKGLMENKFYGPVRLLFIKGAIGGFTALCMLLIIKASNCSMTFCEDLFDIVSVISTSLTVSMYFLLYFIGSGIYNLFCNLIKCHFNPTYISVSDCTSLIIWTIVLEISGEKGVSSLGYILIGMIFILIGCIVYNEIVIIYLCGLHTYTKKEICERSDQDNSKSVFQEIAIIIEGLT